MHSTEGFAVYNFQYANPTRVCFGDGQIASLPDLIPAGSRLLVLYGGGSIKKNGVYDQLTQALAGRDWQEFPGIGANPQYDQLMEAVTLVKRERIDFLLAVGGGSVVDGTKFVAAAACFEGGDPWEILLHKAPVKAALPLGCVLTLPATGSESNPAAVVSRGEAKLSFMNPLVQPVFAVLDPTTTYSLPTRQIGNGVVDAFVHIIEQYLTFPVGGEVQDRLAEGLLQVLVDNGPKALVDPTHYQVRANLMWAASLALNGLIGRGVPQDWSTHAIGHQLTALHGLDHAQSLAVVLPSLLREQAAQKQEKLAQFAERVWHSSREDKALRIEEAIIRTEQFFQQMGVGTRLADYGLSESCIPGICSNLKRFGLAALGEQQDIDPDKVARILSHAL
ncbi:TPA: iron-containing alcohol dehydrogenase [Aeromonas salmonicida]|uniref:Iron-containing alcohol dehydrogenase n=2 Tax=Aeromonas salmonicida subsp. salmonicida TaxID=29491 RepID=A4SRZ9_AERS4|nr:iron-containing alcohol dehydrogenase [Aeromonas salmonicida]ABO91671.1 iron-containing alcohol dehydrogenase [Aeromonas salmonicida subsp. salmonicida A449]AYO64773.1 NADH-dependent alcohol dehydrogenase [Aeromonas salmonicida subsp. salmonicida 01-B526]EHI52190.1 iron-containing alcohol dehydrogenase [Aeromonas salmonicida subsp. salmonicida 01-B526]EKP0238845.1 iron-containing alcohol dehydrogenase [Aeromonas salmonicida]EKP0243029.1 iron-containing alcohol dehydrogenase [Aeromonas salmo